jgi:anti-sigma regulatory factor (Ser/Thr protein kinase)
MMTLNLSSDDELATASNKLKNLNDNKITFDLSNYSFVKPYQLVRIRCLYDLALELGLSFFTTYPLDQNVKDYCGRMGLFEGTDYAYPYKKKTEDKFFQLLKITNDRNETVYDECQKVLRLSKVTSNYINRLADTFTELADNIYYHSGSKENTGWGYMHAQAHIRSGQIHLGLSDVGVGVYGSYQRTNQVRNRTEEQVITDIFEELESCLNPGPQKGHRGLGLHETKDFIDKHTGHLILSSGNYSVHVNQTGIYPQENKYITEGTWIQMRVPIR